MAPDPFELLLARANANKAADKGTVTERKLNGIRKLRTKQKMSQEEVAKSVGVPLTHYKRIEQGWDPLEPWLVSELAILFETNAASVLGREIPVEEWRDSPHAAGHVEAETVPYGNLTLHLVGQERSYPISHEAFIRLHRQLADRHPGDSDESDNWLHCSTLNNYLLLINPRFLRRLALNSDDDEPIDAYAHPEVYRLLDEHDLLPKGLSPNMQQAVDRWAEAIGPEAAITQTSAVRVLFADGSDLGEERYLIEEDVVTDIYAFEVHNVQIRPNTFLKVDSCGYHVHDYVNLSHVALVEVPLERFTRLSAPE